MDGSGREWGPNVRRLKAWQKREKIKLSAKSVVEIGWFFIEIDESWGKVGCFLEFLAIFEKWLSRFWLGFFRSHRGIRGLREFRFSDTDLHGFLIIFSHKKHKKHKRKTATEQDEGSENSDF